MIYIKTENLLCRRYVIVIVLESILLSNSTTLHPHTHTKKIITLLFTWIENYVSKSDFDNLLYIHRTLDNLSSSLYITQCNMWFHNLLNLMEKFQFTRINKLLLWHFWKKRTPPICFLKKKMRKSWNIKNKKFHNNFE